MRRREFVTLAAVFVCCNMSGAAAAQALFDVGTSIRSVTRDGVRYVLADIPMLEATVGCSPHVCVMLNGGLTAGVKNGFSADLWFGDAIRWRPLRFVSFGIQGRVGTSALTNVTVLGSIGADLSIPVSSHVSMVLGVEYFDRLAKKVGGFLKGPQWYVSGDGIGFRLAIAFTSLGSGGP